MGKKLIKTLICCVALLIGVSLSNAVVVSAKSSGKSADNYVSLSYGKAEKVILVSSYEDFKDKIEMGASPLFIPANNNKYFNQDFSVTFNEPGYIHRLSARLEYQRYRRRSHRQAMHRPHR